jgi:hypothetical protein
MLQEKKIVTGYEQIDPIKDYLAVIFALRNIPAVVHHEREDTGSAFYIEDPLTHTTIMTLNLEKACEYILAYGRDPGAYYRDKVAGNLRKHFFMSPHTRAWLTAALDHLQAASMITPKAGMDYNPADVYAEITKSRYQLEVVLGIIKPERIIPD